MKTITITNEMAKEIMRRMTSINRAHTKVVRIHGENRTINRAVTEQREDWKLHTDNVLVKELAGRKMVVTDDGRIILELEWYSRNQISAVSCVDLYGRVVLGTVIWKYNDYPSDGDVMRAAVRIRAEETEVNSVRAVRAAIA